MEKKPTIGVSQCLLGENVRYDGGHKRFDWIADKLTKHANLKPVCPEVEMGLGVPRPAMRLEYDPEESGKVRSKRKLVASEAKQGAVEDYTQLARETSTKIITQMSFQPKESEFLSGFILTKKSPSCGVERIKVYNQKSGIPDEQDMGFFAEALANHAPLLPIIDSGRLHDADEKENFMKRVVAYHRFHCHVHKIGELQKFHEHYKYILMEHNQDKLRELGRIAANSNKESNEAVISHYRYTFFNLLKETRPTVKSR